MAAVATLVGAACGGRNPPAPAGPFATDATAYVARPVRATPGRYGFTVVARYTNPRAAPVRLAYCVPGWRHPGERRPRYHVERLRGRAGGPDTLGAAYAHDWACVGHGDRIVVAPGATRVDTLVLEGPNSWEGRDMRPVGALEGAFRLVYEAEATPGDPAGPLPDALRRSNVFTVRLSRRPW